MEIGYLTGTAYGSLISVFVPKFEMAVAMTPVLIVPFMIFSGFLVNQANIPYFFYEIEYISPFRYMFVSFIYVRFFFFSFLIKRKIKRRGGRSEE